MRIPKGWRKVERGKCRRGDRCENYDYDKGGTWGEVSVTCDVGYPANHFICLIRRIPKNKRGKR
jgi:hypothetical protein